MEFKIKKPDAILSFDFAKDGITQSFISTWRKCPTRARLGLKGYYIPGESASLVFGSVFHAAMEYCLYEIKNGVSHPDEFGEPAMLESISDYIHEHFNEEFLAASADGKKFYADAFEFIPILMHRYFKFWKEDFFGEHQKEFIHIEKEFAVPLNGILLRGKIDAIFKQANGLWLMEHKTKSVIPDEVLSMTISRDLQVMMYILCHYLETGVWMKGVLYNVIRKPGLRKKITESTKEFHRRCLDDVDGRPQWYFIRYVAPISEKALITFQHRLKVELDKIQEWFSTSEIFDAQYTHECQGVYGRCPFLVYCDSDKTDTTFLQMKKSHHPELKGV